MSDSRPRIAISASDPEAWTSAPDPFGETVEWERRRARARRASGAVLALGLVAITFGVAFLAAGSGTALGWLGVALIVVGIPTVVLGDARLSRISAASRGGPYALGSDAGFGSGFAPGDGGGWGGDCGGGGRGDGAGGGC